MDSKKIKPFLYLGIFYLVVSLVLRVVFIFHPITNADFGIFESLKIILLGLLSDIFVFVLSSSLLALYFLWQNLVNDWVSVYYSTSNWLKRNKLNQ